MVNWLLSAFSVATAEAPAPLPTLTAPLTRLTVGASAKLLPTGNTTLADKTMGSTATVAPPNKAAVAPLGTTIS